MKRYVTETGSSEVRGLFRRKKAVAAARIAYAELIAATTRLHRQADLTAIARDRILDRIDMDFESMSVVELRPVIILRTRDLLLRHPLRGYDAVHLAAALELKNRGASVSFWCADGLLIDAATKEGLHSVHFGAQSRSR